MILTRALGYPWSNAEELKFLGSSPYSPDMGIETKVGVRGKLVGLLAIPTLVAAGFSIVHLANKATAAAEMRQLQQVVELSGVAADLTHELQKERGFTAGFMGSKGANFAAELPLQRGAVDGALEELRKVIEQRGGR